MIILKLTSSVKGVTSPENQKERIQIFVDVLLHHKAKQKWNRIINSV